MKKPFICLVFCFFVLSGFSQTQYEMNQQALRLYEKADKEMSNTYKQALKKTTDPAKKKLLIEAQRAWIKYKEAHCKSVASEYEGGSFQPQSLYMCLTDITKERIKALKEYEERND